MDTLQRETSLWPPVHFSIHWISFEKASAHSEETICSQGSKFFLFRVDPIETEDKDILTKLPSLEEYPFTLKAVLYCTASIWYAHNNSQSEKVYFIMALVFYLFEPQWIRIVIIFLSYLNYRHFNHSKRLS